MDRRVRHKDRVRASQELPAETIWWTGSEYSPTQSPATTGTRHNYLEMHTVLSPSRDGAYTLPTVGSYGL